MEAQKYFQTERLYNVLVLTLVSVLIVFSTLFFSIVLI